MQKLILFLSEKFVAKFLDFRPFYTSGNQMPGPFCENYAKLKGIE